MALIDVDQTLGTAWTPTRQSLNELSHQETMATPTLALSDILKEMPGEWGGCLELLEMLWEDAPISSTGVTTRLILSGVDRLGEAEQALLPTTVRSTAPASLILDRLWGTILRSGVVCALPDV